MEYMTVQNNAQDIININIKHDIKILLGGGTICNNQQGTLKV
jgi:hypothetical protein